MSIDLDDIFEELGEMGKYQIINYFLVSLPLIWTGANAFSNVFTADIPKYRCFVPECEVLENTSYTEPWIEWAIPLHKHQNLVIGTQADSCYRFVSKNLSESVCTKDTFSTDIERCSEWIFADEGKTIVNEWNLTCLENLWKIRLVGTSHFAGILSGSVVLGLAADKYGKKIVFVTSSILMGILGCSQVLSPNYETFIVLIFLHAFATAALYPLSLVLGVEMFGKKKRETAGICLHFFFAIGVALTAVIAWYTRDWVPTQLAISGFPILFVVYYWILPESVRWLLATNRTSEARVVLQKVAKVNKVSWNISEYVSLTGTSDEIQEDLLLVMRDLILSKKLFIRVVMIYTIWFVTHFIYFGLMINSISLYGNKYINFALMGLMELPGPVISWISVKKIGIRISLVASFIFCGTTFFVMLLVNSFSYRWLVVTLYSLGKFGITCSEVLIHMCTMEIFPTNIRSAGMGIGYAFGRLSGLVVPFVPALSLYYKDLPIILLGVLAIAAGILSLWLPETVGIKMPDTVAEAEKI